jgi:putative nucleotidyltransferase with HDIG domain
VLAGLSYALDLTEGQKPGHAVRSCLIGMRIGEAIGLDAQARSSLFYALLMKDLGCSSNAARFAALFGASDHDLKHDIKHIDWSRALPAFRFVLRSVAPGQNILQRAWRLLAVMMQGAEGARTVVRTRCERGADIARLLSLDADTIAAIRALDEHWDGGGQPYALQRTEIPVLARILCLAQTLEVFASAYGEDAAFDMAAARRGTWFDPALVDALAATRSDRAFWANLGTASDLERLRRAEPADRAYTATDDQLDLIAEAFAQVIDAKSPWTYRHSHGVAATAVAIGRHLSYSPATLRTLRRAALLHDVGKLGVSSLILDKPARLTDAELAVVQTHPGLTAQILGRVPAFDEVLDTAASHHERLDGRGYHRGLRHDHLGPLARVLGAADICDALRASRPYRAGLDPDRVLAILAKDVGKAVDSDCYEALRVVLRGAYDERMGDTPAAKLVTSLAEDYRQAA